MGYTLALPCRKCGGDITVNSKEEKARKDAEGVDEHTYDKVCERARLKANKQQGGAPRGDRAPQDGGSRLRAASSGSRRVVLQRRAGTEQQGSAAAQQHSSRAEHQSRVEQSRRAAEQGGASRAEQDLRAGLEVHQTQIDRLRSINAKLEDKLQGKAKREKELAGENEHLSVRLGELILSCTELEDQLRYVLHFHFHFHFHFHLLLFSIYRILRTS